MSLKAILVVLLAAAFVFSGSMNSAWAQTSAAQDNTAKDNTAKDKATEKKSKAEARKAAAAERKAKIAEKKAQTKATRKAAHERQKQCSAEWKKARTDGTIEKGMTWPKYYSACNRRLKEKTA